jgi:hypothetical protein
LSFVVSCLDKPTISDRGTRGLSIRSSSLHSRAVVLGEHSNEHSNVILQNWAKEYSHFERANRNSVGYATGWCGSESDWLTIPTSVEAIYVKLPRQAICSPSYQPQIIYSKSETLVGPDYGVKKFGIRKDNGVRVDRELPLPLRQSNNVSRVDLLNGYATKSQVQVLN